jgi:Rhodopirellula transposase DDE domain
VSHVRVGELLHELHYSLQSNAKVIEGGQHPDRDAQFGYINTKVRAFLRRGDPVISVDALCGRPHKASYADLAVMPSREQGSRVGADFGSSMSA